MTARGNKWETRWPGLMSSGADGSTYSAPVVETGSSFHSSRIVNATSSPLSWVFSPIAAHAVARSLQARAALAARRNERADDVGPACRPGDRQRREVAKRSACALPEQPCAAGCAAAGGVPYGYRDT